jgi:hypothetical protein
MDQQEIERRFTKRINNLVCYNTYLRIVNQVIYKEFVFGLWNKQKNWSVKASERLKRDHGIETSPSTLIQHLLKIKNKTRNSIAASDFTTGISYESIPVSRYEKDSMHARMDALKHEFISGPYFYVGLPANQIIAVSRQYNYVTACEQDYLMSKFMCDMNRYIGKGDNVKVYNESIFNFLKHTDIKFNVFEFDFMGIITPKLIEEMAFYIKKTSMNRALIAITSVGGRKITIQKYKELMPSLFLHYIARNEDFSVINRPYSGKYKDHRTPMQYELLVIEK